MSLQVAQKSDGRVTPSSFSPKLIVKTGSQSRRNDTAKRLAQGRDRNSPVNGFTPPGGADLVVALEPFDLGDEIEDRWRKFKSERWRVFAEFTFGDLDSDGTTDLIFSEQMVRLGIDEETGTVALAATLFVSQVDLRQVVFLHQFDQIAKSIDIEYFAFRVFAVRHVVLR